MSRTCECGHDAGSHNALRFNCLATVAKRVRCSCKRYTEKIMTENERVYLGPCGKCDGYHGSWRPCVISDAAADAKDAARYRWLRDTFHAAKGGAHLAVNDVLAYYETPEPGKEVELHWYPETPIGFYEVHGSTLDEAIDRARANAHPTPAGNGDRDV